MKTTTEDRKARAMMSIGCRTGHKWECVRALTKPPRTCWCNCHVRDEWKSGR